MPAVYPLGALQAKRANALHAKTYVAPAHAWLASELARTLADDPELHRQHVLPGAKRAVTTAYLAEQLSRGLTHHEVTSAVNDAMDRANAPRMAQLVHWRDGERLEQLERAQERERRRQLAEARALLQIEAEEGE